jgi:hypothetical protein
MTWNASVERSVWGRLQVVIEDTDVTFFRDVPMEVVSWSSGDPFDDATAVFRFPQISPFEKEGVGELSWLRGHSLVDIYVVRPDTSRKKLWEGMVASIEEDLSESSSAITIQCIGALYQLDYYIRTPKNLDDGQERLYEHAIRNEFSPPNPEREAMKTGRCRIVYPEGMTDTGWKTKYSGAWENALTGYIQRLLADMVHNPGLIREPGSPEIPGTAGTNAVQDIVLAPDQPPFPWGNSYPSASLNGTFRLVFRNEYTPGRNSPNALRWNSTAADVKTALQNLSTIDEVNVSGLGTAASPWRVTFVGAKVRQRPQPAMKLIHDDLRHDHSKKRVTIIQAGETGTPSTPAVPPSDPEPWEGAWTLMKNRGRIPVLRLRDEATVSWTVHLGAPGVVHSLKSDYSQTPNVFYGEGTDESATTWRNSTVTVDNRGNAVTRHYPLAWDESTYPARKSVSEGGEPTDPPPLAYSDDNVRVEIVQKYGAGVSLLDARRSAEQQVIRESDPGWFGTITLTTDPEEGSRFEIKAGTNLRLKYFKGLSPARKEIFQELLDREIFDDQFHSIPMLRGQFASVLRKTLDDAGATVPSTGSTFFSDVSGAHADSINRLAALGIVTGFNDGTFRPDQAIKRDEMARYLVKAYEWASGETLTATYNHFNDSMGTSEVSRTFVNEAIENDLVTMYPNRSYYPRQEATRLEAGESMYLLNSALDGDMLEDAEGLFLHIAQAEVNFESGSVTLTVDSKSRDLATLAQLIERTKDENKNPAKMLMVNRESGSTDDTKFPWDYNAGSGSIPKQSRAARHGTLPRGTPSANPDWFVYVNGANGSTWKRWTIVPVVAAGKGSVQRTEIRAYNSSGQPLAIPFHVGVYSLYITEYSMPQFPFQPGAFSQPADSGDALSGYDPSAVVLWGQQGQRAGYWPGLESEGNPVTGILIDEGTWQFQLPEGENVLWVAFYAEVNAWFQGRFYHGVQS